MKLILRRIEHETFRETDSKVPNQHLQDNPNEFASKVNRLKFISPQALGIEMR